MASDHSRSEILDIIERQAERSGIPREDFLRFAYIETGGRFDPDAHNRRSDARGLFQFLPGTAAEFNLTGREFDPAANTEAAAALYRRNMNQILRRTGETGHAFLSGEGAPNGLDMYLAHQQGGGGYASIQSAIATGAFSRSDTRRNMLANIAGQDFERVTGQPFPALAGMNDRDLATSFTRYWSTKYAAIEIADRGIHAAGAAVTATASTGSMEDVLRIGDRGDSVRALQQSLNQLQFRDARGAELETRSGIYGDRTAEAVRSFQAANAIEATGAVDQRTRDAIAAQLRLPETERNRLPQPQERADEQAFWPAPGNYELNRKDKPGEGDPNQGWTRRDASGNPRFHGGVDIEGRVGDPIVAFSGGTVQVRPNNGRAGNTVQIDHDDGTVTKYFHLDRITAVPGRIEAGQPIGTMGRTGNVPARGDTHLHFELWRDGRPIDPMPHLEDARDRGRTGASSAPGAATQDDLRDNTPGTLQHVLHSARSGDERALRAALEDYLRSPEGRAWQQTACAPGHHQAHDPAQDTPRGQEPGR